MGFSASCLLRSTPTLTTRSLSNDTAGPYTHIPCDVDRHICRNAILCRRSTRERDFRQDMARRCRRADLPRGRFGQRLHARTRFPADITMTTPEATLPQNHFSRRSMRERRASTPPASHFFETLHARTRCPGHFSRRSTRNSVTPKRSGSARRDFEQTLHARTRFRPKMSILRWPHSCR